MRQTVHRQLHHIQADTRLWGGLLLSQRRRRRANIELLFCFTIFQIFLSTHDTDSARFGVCDLKKPCYREDDYAV